MNILKLRDVSDHGEVVEQARRVLERGGLICVPCNGSYRIMCDLADEAAVMRLFQSKRRVGKAPSLVFVDSEATLREVADGVEPAALDLARRFWPGPLTVLFDPNPELPRKVTKALSKANGKLGVRIPDDALCQAIAAAFGHPLLVSSANREKRHGESSPAQVRQTFLGRVDLFVDAGDLREEPSSTVVEVEGGKVRVVREGAIGADAFAGQPDPSGGASGGEEAGR